MTTKNEVTSFENELFKKLRIKEAWKNLSNSEFNWTASLIEKHKEKINWDELSKSNNVEWSIDLLEKYQYSINWNELSESIFSRPNRYHSEKNYTQISASLLSKFENRWNWNKVSENSYNVTDEILETFSNQLDWKEIINNRNISWNTLRYEKFKKHMPLYDIDYFTKSHLWNELVEIEEKILEGKILANS